MASTPRHSPPESHREKWMDQSCSRRQKFDLPTRAGLKNNCVKSGPFHIKPVLLDGSEPI